ncbi:MAG: adenylate kinase [Nitrososphaerales archaeon]
MKLRVVVVGIPGVGKTTVVEKLRSRLEGAKLVTFGTVMFEEALRRKWVKGRDEMRKLPVERQKKLQAVAAAKISKMADQVVLVDTHLFIRTNEGFWPGLPFEVVRALNPTHLVLVEASPEEVSARRAADAARSRDSVDKEELEKETELGRAFLSVSSTLTGAPMLIVRNAEGKADATAEALAAVIKGAVR